MKVSTKGRYALRLMIDLAANYNGEYITLKSVSERQQLSVKYLEQIIPSLVRAGYIKGLRGSKGGYMLTKPPEKYTAGMILRVSEGLLHPVDCVDSELYPCKRALHCKALPLWKRLDIAIASVLDSVTLIDLLNEGKENINKI